MEREQTVLEQKCREAVDLLLSRHTWQLLDREEFVQRTLEHLCTGIAADPRRAATYTYSRALHTACSGTEGAERQNLGYTELFRYLYDSARRRYPDVCDDVTQRALEKIFTAFERCRQPGAFLAFAFQQLLDAARAIRRQEERYPHSLARSVGDGYDILGDLVSDPRQMDPAAQVIVSERRVRFEQCAAEFLHKHPRASQQLAALWLKYIEGFDDTTISRKLDKPLSSIYVLRSRAIEKLQAEPSWRALAIEFGIIADKS